MSEQTGDKLDELIDVMRALRDPDSGCPWDLEQNWQTILPHTIEEVYEVADAIEREDYEDLRSELGDLLFQIVFYAQLGHEQNRFDFMDIAAAITEKLIRRHPHVFGQSISLTSEQQTHAWEAQKAQERADRARQSHSRNRILDDIPTTMPAMLRALKLQKRAGRVGFDWPDIKTSLMKVDEELGELRDSIVQTENCSKEQHAAVEDELGDLLFSVVNSARKLEIDPEQALRRANEKFVRRFQYIEDRLNDTDRKLETMSADQLESLWVEAKRELDCSGRKP